MIGYLTILPLMFQNELPNMEKLFKDVKWEEIEDTMDKGYEVEKVTMVAGVRGNEAEHEILAYLYYIVDTKTGENSLKTKKPIHIPVF